MSFEEVAELHPVVGADMPCFFFFVRMPCLGVLEAKVSAVIQISAYKC